jgi:hypothetical protein
MNNNTNNTNDINDICKELEELKIKYNKLLLDYEILKNDKTISLGSIIDIIQRYQHYNMSINDIAKYYNISSGLVLNILYNNNIITLPNKENTNSEYISDDELSLSSSPEK